MEHLIISDGDQITKRTIIKDKKIDSNGNERPFIREITEFKDVEGNVSSVC